MRIDQVRIDDRLIHGQVVRGWLKPLKIGRVLIVSERLVSSPMQKTLLAIAAVESILVEALDVSDSVSWLKKNSSSSEKIMVLSPGPKEILLLLENGVRFPVVTVGGLHSPKHVVKASPSILLTESDCRELKKIAEKGVLLHAQDLPSQAPKNISEILC